MKRLKTALLGACLSFAPMTNAVAAPPPAEAYAQLPGVLDAAITPDGKSFAAIVEMGGEYLVRIFDFNAQVDANPRGLRISTEARPQWMKWANNDKLLVSLEGTQMFDGVIINTGDILVVNRAASEQSFLIERQASRSAGNFSNIKRNDSTLRQFNNQVVDFLVDDPDHILMQFGDRDRYAPDVQKVNVNDGKYQFVRRGTRDYQSWATDLRGEVRVGEGRRELNGEWQMTIRDADGDKWRMADYYLGLSARANVIGFTENPNEMIIRRYAGSDTLGLHIYDLSQKKYTRKLFQNSDYDVSGLILSPDGKKVIGATYIADTIQKEFFDPASKAKLAKVAAETEGYTVRYIDETPDGSKVLFKAYAPDVPAKFLAYDFNKNAVSFLGSDYMKLDKVQHGDVKSVSYPARDGEQIPSYVTLPYKVTNAGTAKDIPFIVLPHGGPFARDTNNFDYLAQFFASRGYGVLQMNFRGSVGYGRKFNMAGRDNWVVMQEDVEDGARWLVEKGYADPKRMCIVGWSYGGYAALMAALKNPELYACNASIAGVTDLQDMIRDMEKYRFGDRNAEGFILRGFETRDDIKANSPVKLADGMSVPTFIAHGTMDAVVHFDQFKRMKKALKKSGTKVTALELKDGRHSLDDAKNRLELLEGLEKFLEKNLGKSKWAS